MSTGFFEAGKVLSNVTTAELQAIIDEEHKNRSAFLTDAALEKIKKRA